uniref:PLAC8 like 1 n=1 Tax=Pseudonaja textilis TaxID=8673 RepID=A0A670XWR4_PSETE
MNLKKGFLFFLSFFFLLSFLLSFFSLLSFINLRFSLLFYDLFIYFTRSKSSAEPVTIQPCATGTFATSNMTTLLHTGGNWSTGLFDICSDKTICMCGLLCSPCLECRLASKYGECFCFPLLLGSTLALRAGIRGRHSIHGTLCEDWMAVHCCWPCAICQMAREMRIRPLFQVYKMHRSPPPLLAKDALV